MQNLKKNWLVLWKMTWGIWQFFTKTLGSVEIGTLMASFIQNRKCMSQKITEELWKVMKNDEKFEEELTCHFKIDIRNLTNFESNTWKYQGYAL